MFAAWQLLVRKSKPLLQTLGAEQESALPEEAWLDSLLVEAAEPLEERRQTVEFVELEQVEMQMLVKTLGVDHEESFGYHRRGKARGLRRSLRRN